jgi:hypothetical protein
MAVGQVDPQFSQVHTLGVTQGIKRDGTVFESREYSGGVWCRFQRGTPKKMGGYRQLFNSFSGIPRGFITNPYNGVNYSFAGTQVGLDVFTTGTTLGAGSGPFNAIFRPGYSKFPITGDTITNTTTSFVIDSNATSPINYTSVYPPGTKVIFTQSGTPTVYTVTTSTFATPNTTVNFTPAVGGSVVISNVWIYNEFFEPDPRLMWQFDFQYDPSGGSLKLLAHPGLNLQNIDNGVNTAIYYGDTLPNSSAQWTFDVLADSTGQNPTYLPISVDGGVCCLYPFIFAYGSNGFISNNNVDTTYADQTPTDWNGPLANQVNMSASKIVKGMPTRGGTNAPSGLFWALDSLIRTSFTGAAPNYWRYDIVSSQISIMSSAAVVEMDGTYYWMGVDRFYAYNGSVTVVPNDKNVNWLFDNLNYTQRQKVWATKVPRYNEIWFFYPRDIATECTDAIIYNVKDKIWYDAGQATGSQRSCGYTTEIFPTPVWCDWNYNVEYSQAFNTINAVPLGLAAPTTFQIYVTGDQSQVFSPGDYLTFSNTLNAPTYQIASAVFLYNTGSNPLPGCTLITVETQIDPYPTVGQLVYMIHGGYAIWQHEFGLNKVTFLDESAIQSSFTTCDISWVGGTPSQDTAQGVNRRMHLRRIEPDFVQVGPMTLDIIGRKFASGESEEISGPFTFDENTPKIDLRVEHREARLKFESNTINGNYEMGRILITAEYGDERP